jgi:hypothetical protein
MPITKESLVSDLPGVSPAQAVALNRLGITRVGELIAADYESVAVTLESFDEATRLLREAKKHTESNDSKAHVNAAANAQAQAAAAARAKVAPRHRPHPHAKPAAHSAPQPVHGPHSAPRPHSPQPVPQPAARPAGVRFAGDAAPAPNHSGHHAGADQGAKRSGGSQDDGMLSTALSLAGRGIDFSGADGRAALSRRLGATTFLLEHEAEEADAIAALILEGVEDGSIPAASVARDFGEQVGQLVEECATIRAVPVSPLGKLPKYYLEMAQKTSVSSRRVCAAHQIAHLHLNAEAAVAAGESRGGVVWYARLLLEALEAGGPDPVVSLLRSSVDALSRVAA